MVSVFNSITIPSLLSLNRNSLVVQWVRDLVFSLWIQFNSWPRNLHMLLMWPKKFFFYLHVPLYYDAQHNNLDFPYSSIFLFCSIFSPVLENLLMRAYWIRRKGWCPGSVPISKLLKFSGLVALWRILADVMSELFFSEDCLSCYLEKKSMVM